MRETLKFLLGDFINGKNNPRNGIFLKKVLQRIDRSKDGIAVHLFTLVS